MYLDKNMVVREIQTNKQMELFNYTLPVTTKSRLIFSWEYSTLKVVGI